MAKNPYFPVLKKHGFVRDTSQSYRHQGIQEHQFNHDRLRGTMLVAHDQSGKPTGWNHSMGAFGKSPASLDSYLKAKKSGQDKAMLGGHGRIGGHAGHGR